MTRWAVWPAGLVVWGCTQPPAWLEQGAPRKALPDQGLWSGPGLCGREKACLYIIFICILSIE